MITNPNSEKPKLNQKTFENIFKGQNEELKKALTTDYKRSFWGGPLTEDDKLASRKNNQPKEQQYITPDDLEANRGNPDVIIDDIDKGVIGDFIDSMKIGDMHRGKVVAKDKTGNSIVTFYEGDIYGIVYAYKNQKKPLQIGDKKVFAYEGKNKKGRLQFKLGKHKKTNTQKLKKTNNNKQAIIEKKLANVA